MIGLILMLTLIMVLVFFLFGKRKKRILLIVLLIPFFFMTLLWIISTFFKPYNSFKRNKIVFSSQINEVQDSIIKMSSLLHKLPAYKDDWVEYELNDSDILYVNFEKIGHIANLNALNNSIRSSVFINYTSSDLVEFEKLAPFLKKNFLSRCDYFKNSATSNFVYREYKEDAGDYHDDLLRFIFYSSRNTYERNIFKEIDKNDKLILLVRKDANIWIRER